MGKFIKVIKTGIDVSKVTEQLRRHPGDWDHQKSHEGVHLLDEDHDYDDLPIGNLQLTIGAAAGEAVTIDAYVCYDSLFYIDASGSIRVSF